jgi:hypothetical protein
MKTAGLLLAAVFASVPLLAGSHTQAADPGTQDVDLTPPERAAWTPKNVLVGVSGIFGSYGYWYDDRSFAVETVPPESQLGLYYLRKNFQKRFVRANAPANVKLPPRADTTPKDAVRISVTANGYLSQDVSFGAREVPERVTITLKALPNALVSVAQTSFGGRTTITLRTTEQPELRLSKAARFPGFTISLSKTALKIEGKVTGTGARLRSLDATQVGEDAIVRVETDAPDVEVRSKQSFDPVSSQYVSVFDLVQPGTIAPTDGEVRARLDGVAYTPDTACDARYAAVLREKLGDAVIADAFRPAGGIADLYRREAMLRLGRFREGSVRTEAGETLRTGNPLELALALQSAGTVDGYLALLGALARSEAHPADALRSLVAPQMSAADFAPVYEAAEATRASCHR